MSHDQFVSPNGSPFDIEVHSPILGCGAPPDQDRRRKQRSRRPADC